MKEKLKELDVADDVADKVMAEIGKSYVPAETHNTVKSDLEKDISTLKADIKANDGKHAAELNAVKLEHAVQGELSKAGVRSAKAVKAELDEFFKTAELDENGGVKGLSAELEKLAKNENTSFLFNSDDGNKPRFQGVKPVETGGGVAKSFTESDLKNMTAAQVADNWSAIESSFNLK